VGIAVVACDGGGSTGGHGGSAASSSSDASSSSSGAGGGSSAHLAEWARTFIGSQQRASSVGTDEQGNIYVGGTFESGAVDFGAGQLDCPPNPGGPTWCGFLLKLDPTGKTLWSRAFAASHTLNIDVTALGAGAFGVVIAARWQRYQLPHSPLDVGTGPLDPPGDNPMVLAKFDPSGKPLWSAAFGDDSGEVVPASLFVDAAGSFTIGGGFSTATLNLGPGPMPFVGPRTLFLAHFDSAMTVAWQKSFGGMTGQELAGFGTSPKGELLLGGYFKQSLGFGGPPLMSNGKWSIFQATLDASGGFVSNKSFDATGAVPSVTSASVDAAGSMLVTGLFDGMLDLGAKPLGSQGSQNGYLAKIDAQGQIAFAQATTESSMSVGGTFCVAADASNNVLWGADLFFSTPMEDYVQGRITKLDPSGATLWSVAGKNFGARAFAFDASANVIAVGEFSTALNLAKGGPIMATKGSNAFIAKFLP